MEITPTLEGRIAVCPSCKTETASSSKLSFFVYRGPESEEALEICVCGFHADAHQPVNPSTGRSGISSHDFKAVGDRVDTFYCGCQGWD